MMNIASFFSRPILLESSLNKPTYDNSAKFEATRKSSYEVDPKLMRSMNNIQRDLIALKNKQKSDPNSQSLAKLIEKKEKALQQVAEFSRKRDESVFGLFNDVIEASKGYFTSSIA